MQTSVQSAALVLEKLRPSPATLRAFGLLVVLLCVLFVASGQVSGHQILDNMRQAAPLGIITLGQALILMMGRLNLSVGATAGLANVVLAMTFAGNMDNMAYALKLARGRFTSSPIRCGKTKKPRLTSARSKTSAPPIAGCTSISG
mgnify:CR=1 FL=1